MTESITLKEYMLSLMILNLLGLIATTEKKESIEMLSESTCKELLDICKENIGQYEHEMVQGMLEDSTDVPRYTESH